MSFQAYLDTIQAKTGRDLDALKAEADAQGLSAGGRLKEGVKAARSSPGPRPSWALATATPWRSTPCFRG